MSSVLRSAKKRKKSRRLGEVEVISREEYAEYDLDARVEAIRALVPLGLMHVEETLDQEVTALAGDLAHVIHLSASLPRYDECRAITRLRRMCDFSGS